GSNRYMHAIFGLRVDGRASRTLAAPVSHMLARIHADAALTPQQREMLYTALYRAFSADMDGDTQYLDSALNQAGLRVPE
ncbi:MAG: hypothetical protein Q4E72_12345, partial [bacterium]|nr:hypothetical protein [bacterium]